MAMAGKDMLSNVTYFLQIIIPEACNTGKWTDESVNEAFLWAGYCEELYKNAITQPTAEQLNSCIKTIGIEIEGEGTNISLEYLKFSSELLLKAFLQNPLIENSVLQLACEKSQQKGIDINQLIQEKNEMKKLCIDVLHTFSKFQGEHVSVLKETEANFLLESMRRRVIGANEYEIETWLIDFLKNSCETKDQIESLLYVLVLHTKNHSVARILQQFCLAYICQRITLNHNLFSFVVANNTWKQSVHLLRTVASKHFIFYRCYIDTLVNCCRLLRQNCENSAPEWKMIDSSCIPNFTFKELVAHFQCLSDSQDKAARSTRNLLRALAENPKEPSMWIHIIYHFRTDLQNDIMKL